MEPNRELHSLYAADGGVHTVFTGKVADYVASRPDYPAALFDTLQAHCGLPPGALVADLGAGTGLLSRGLLQRGWRVVGVEPNAPMRAAAQHFLAQHERYQSVDGSAESMPLADSSIDLVTAAQAFHWFDVDAARSECLRVLKAHGPVALVWNDRRRGDALHDGLDQIFAEFGGAKRTAMVAQDDRADVPRFFGATVPQQWRWPHEHRLDAVGLLSLAFSRSYMPARDSNVGRAAAQRLNRLFDELAVGGGVAVRYTTLAIIGRPG